MQQLTHPADTISCVAGTHIVQLIRGERTLRLEVLTGSPVGQLVDELTHPYELSQEPLARTLARVLAVALRAGATTDEARRAVVDHLDAELAFILADPSIDSARAGIAVQDEKARWESAEDQAWAADLLDDMRAFLRGRMAG